MRKKSICPLESRTFATKNNYLPSTLIVPVVDEKFASKSPR